MILEKKQPSFWKETWYNLEKWAGLHYDPEDYPDAPKPDTPPTTRRQPTPTTQIVGDNVKYSPTTGKWLRENVGQNTDNDADKTTDTKRRAADTLPTTPTTYSWDVLSTPTNTAELNTARSEKLTDGDLKLITERGLDIAKAQTIKAFWFRKIPRNLAGATLSKQAKGYSEAIINPYYTVFNAALKMVESPTLEAK